MKKQNAIPDGYMTVGEIARKMETTVRTLQFYDRTGLLSPSAKSEGGRRLYTDKDLVRLHQILSLKKLGFSLDDIRLRLIPLETPAEVARVLDEQADSLRQQLEVLSEALRETELLKAEVQQMQTVDFKKYADILVNLQMKNEGYALIKHFDEPTLDFLRRHFDCESAQAFLSHFGQLTEEILQLHKEGVPPDSARGQAAAKAYWNLLMEFAEGDTQLLARLNELADTGAADGEWAQKQALVGAYITPALEVYFAKTGTRPFGDTPDGR